MGRERLHGSNANMYRQTGRSQTLSIESYSARSGNRFVIRTCGLYGVRGSGGKGGNFVETMLRLAKDGKPLRVVNDQHCTPSFPCKNQSPAINK